MRNLILAAMLVPLPALAGEAGAFLDIGVGARVSGMGGAGTALADDAAAIYWNPAGLARLEKQDLSFSHAELAVSQRHDFLGYAKPVEGVGTFGAALTYLSYGGLDGRDGSGRKTADFGASDAAASFAFARKVEDGEAGLAVKFVRSHIAEAEATTVAADFGVAKSLDAGGGKGRAAAAVRNFGPGLKYDDRRDPLPTSLNLGVSWEKARLTLTGDYRYFARRGGHEGGVGAEFSPVEGFAGRAGYTSQSAGGGSGFDALKGFTMGAGFKLGRARVDYAAIPGGELGLAHRVDFGLRW